MGKKNSYKKPKLWSIKKICIKKKQKFYETSVIIFELNKNRITKSTWNYHEMYLYYYFS